MRIIEARLIKSEDFITLNGHRARAIYFKRTLKNKEWISDCVTCINRDTNSLFDLSLCRFTSELVNGLTMVEVEDCEA